MSGPNSPTWEGGLVERACLVCGKTLKVKPSHIKKGEGKTCSKTCRIIWHAKEMAKRPSTRAIKSCQVCGTAIHVRLSRVEKEGMFCSRECMAQGYRNSLLGSANPKWRGGKIVKICKQCGGGFEVSPGATDDHKFCSQSCSATWRMLNEHIKGRARGGKREDLNNRYFRSSWEANYARYLNWLVSIGEIKSWDYEADTFVFKSIKRGNMTYLPDFKITNKDGSIEYHEVKGYMDDDSAVKLRRMAKYYPDVKLVLVGASVYKAIANQVKPLIPNWESTVRSRAW